MPEKGILLEGMTSRKRRPNWTDQECLFLAHLLEERKDIIRGKCSTGISTQTKRQAWEEITRAINLAFPQYHRTISDCNKKWENLLAKSREEIKRHTLQMGKGENLSPEQFSDVTQIVLSVMNLTDKLPQDRKDFLETQQCFEDDVNSCSTGETSPVVFAGRTEIAIPACSSSPAIHTEDFMDQASSSEVHKMVAFNGAPNSISVPLKCHFNTDPFPPAVQMITSRTTASAQQTTLQERMDLELSVLRRQEAVLKLQEEYYTLKIKLMKRQMAEGGVGHSCKLPQ